MKIVTWENKEGFEMISNPSPELRNNLGDNEAAQYVAENDLPTYATNVAIVDEADLIEPLWEAQSRAKNQVEEEYQRILKRGVSWTGKRWSATDANRDTLVELHETAQELGQSVTVLDAENSAYTLTADDLSNLRAAGRSYRHAAREKRLALHGQINAATTHADLDAIDPTSGWPT